MHCIIEFASVKWGFGSVRHSVQVCYVAVGKCSSLQHQLHEECEFACRWKVSYDWQRQVQPLLFASTYLHVLQVVRHVFSWAYGDGQLMHQFPHLAYRRPPNALELSCLIMLWHVCQHALTV